jgi:hypothetical protein
MRIIFLRVGIQKSLGQGLHKGYDEKMMQRSPTCVLEAAFHRLKRPV